MRRTENIGPFFFDDMALKGDSGEVNGPEREDQLPWRKCETCGEKEWHPYLARYGLGIPRTLDSKLFKSYHLLSIDEFDVVLQKFPVDEKTRKSLLPGTRIGTPTFKLVTKPYDFINKWTTVVSERTLDAVRARGVRVDAVPLNVTSSRKRSIPDYYYIIPHVAAIMEPEWMKLELERCWRCENWWPKKGLKFPKIVRNDKAHILRRQWPEGAGVIYSKDLGSTYYSPEFVRACIDAKLTGIAFGQTSWVE